MIEGIARSIYCEFLIGGPRKLKWYKGQRIMTEDKSPNGNYTIIDSGWYRYLAAIPEGDYLKLEYYKRHFLLTYGLFR